MLALACNRMNRPPVIEIHARYCCGKRVLLARAQGNECRMAITALGEVTFGRICNMQAAVKSHGSTELERAFNASQNHSTHSQWLSDPALIYVVGNLEVNIRIYFAFTFLGMGSFVFANKCGKCDLRWIYAGITNGSFPFGQGQI